MTFCSQDLIDQLRIKGSSQPLSLSTLNANENVKAIAVGLEIAGTSDECQQNLPITLPNVLAIKEFPNLMASH